MYCMYDNQGSHIIEETNRKAVRACSIEPIHKNKKYDPRSARNLISDCARENYRIVLMRNMMALTHFRQKYTLQVIS